MKSHSWNWRRFSVLLPLIMVVLQFGLLAASLIVNREPWVFPDPSIYPPPSESDCSGSDCTITFTMPPEPRMGVILKAEMLLNLPAVLLGSIFHIAAGAVHLPQSPGEPTLIGYSTLFVPLLWYRVGRWADDQMTEEIVLFRARVVVRTAWKQFTRVAVWTLFGISSCGFLFVDYHQSDATHYMEEVFILWAGVYLAVGLLADWRVKYQAKIQSTMLK